MNQLTKMNTLNIPAKTHRRLVKYVNRINRAKRTTTIMKIGARALEIGLTVMTDEQLAKWFDKAREEAGK